MWSGTDVHRASNVNKCVRSSPTKKRQELISRFMIFSTSPNGPGVLLVSKRLPITSGARKVASINSHAESTHESCPRGNWSQERL